MQQQSSNFSNSGSSGCCAGATCVPQVSMQELISAHCSHAGLQGFPAKLRTAEVSELESDEAEAKREADARRSLINLGMAWSLVLLCCSHHIGHMLHMMGYHQFAHTPFMAFMSNPSVSGALGAFALFGPGRTLLLDGAKSLLNNTPNMNSLVALGSVTR